MTFRRPYITVIEMLKSTKDWNMYLLVLVSLTIIFYFIIPLTLSGTVAVVPSMTN